jgi:protein-histidine pros-kinase
MTELRESLADLRGDPASRPLVERLRAPAEAAAARAGWKLELELDRVDVAPEAEHALVRIAREALANAERHAAACHVTLALRSVAERIELLVADDGAGFEPTTVGGSHFGLRGMRERAALLGATLEVRTGPGLGTEVRLRTPAPSPRPEAAAS